MDAWANEFEYGNHFPATVNRLKFFWIWIKTDLCCCRTLKSPLVVRRWLVAFCSLPIIIVIINFCFASAPRSATSRTTHKRNIGYFESAHKHTSFTVNGALPGQSLHSVNPSCPRASDANTHRDNNQNDNLNRAFELLTNSHYYYSLLIERNDVVRIAYHTFFGIILIWFGAEISAQFNHACVLCVGTSDAVWLWNFILSSSSLGAAANNNNDE